MRKIGTSIYLTHRNFIDNFAPKSFIGSMFSNSNGAGFQASGADASTLTNQYNAGQGNLASAAQGYNTLATQGSQLAQNQLAASNAQGIQQASGLVSSQKGLNPALATRMAGQNAAQSMNQGANQSAQLQAQTQMAGLQGLSNTASQQSGLANQQLGAQNSANAGIAAGNQANQAKLFSGALNGASTAATMYQGGKVPHYFDGTLGPQGATANDASVPPTADLSLPGAAQNASIPPSPVGPQSVAGKFFQGFNQSMQTPSGSKAAGSIANSSIQLPSDKSQGSSGSSAGTVAKLALFSKGGQVPAMLSPGERYLPPSEAKAVVQGKESPLKAGQEVPGKAKVKGNSLKNDTVPATLEEGGIVIPRSIMQSKDAAKKAAAFVAAHLKGKKSL